MPIANTTETYGAVARSLHWLTALLIFTAIGLSFLMPEGLVQGAEAARWAQLVFSLHKTVGVAAFFVALLRIFWALIQAKPGAIHPGRKIETFVADVVHWALYAAMVVMPLSGWIYHSTTTGFAPIFWPFGQDLPLVPKSEGFGHVAMAVHKLSSLVLYGAIGLHVLGALKHALIDRDGTLARMTKGIPVAVPPLQTRSFRPAQVAFALWAAVIVVAPFLPRGGPEAPPATEATATAPAPAATGTAATDTAAPQTAAPQTAAPQTTAPHWAVETGNLGITVQQMGAAVTGSFSGWTANIAYDPDTRTGSVTVTIPVGGLKLGQVTDQATGPDFLDVAQFPQAVFQGVIAPAGEGLAATGTLDLHGRTMPLTLPFTLSIEGGTATMAGFAEIDRRDFGIGAGYGDEKTVGYPVRIDVTLTATRQ